MTNDSKGKEKEKEKTRRKFLFIHDVHSFMLHLPMGLAIGVIALISIPAAILAACIFYGTIKYQEHEQGRIGDWPDIDLQGTIAGMTIAGLVWAAIKLVLRT